MASSSSSSHIKRYHVFLSFHGRDVRGKFLSHLRSHFASKGITTFNDQEIERGSSIGPDLVQAIRESRVWIVLLSKNYASSSWCLDELVEIFKCKEDQKKQTVMTVFYDVNPSDVRKQRGDFGSAFVKTCEGKAEEVKQRWSKVLTDVANIEGEHSLNWANEAEMIQKIATDVSKKLNFTPSRDFDNMVGLEAHLANLSSLLCLESNDVKMVGIWGPAGIGKTTIARALYNLLSSDFRLKCFMGNLRFKVDDYDSKLCLQNQLLSKILNQRDVRVLHLEGIKEWLQDQRVLIILDDVDDVEQLKVLARELSWFGSGSRVIVTTQDKKILKAHEIDLIYHVDFPSEKEALEILSLSAFKQSSPPDGFEELAKTVAELCGNLPLGLCVVGSSYLRGESKQEWELQLSRIEASLDRKIEVVLRVGYDRLSKKDQALFLHIACIFNNNCVDSVKAMLASSNLDVENGLKTLAIRSLVQIDRDDQKIVMHSLLEQMGRQIVYEQSDEPGKRQFLVEVEEICDVLAKATGTGSVKGISFDMSKMSDFSVSGRAFEGMRNLGFLRFYVHNWNFFREDVPLRIPEDMEYLPLKLLHWDLYPRKRLPPTFQPECLVEFSMQYSNLEKLWGGVKLLPNLKTINLRFSKKLKEIPNLSNATNLETLRLQGCTSLVELPSSIRNLHKLEELDMSGCENLRVIPTNINLASLKRVEMRSCSRLRTFPDISSNISLLDVRDTKIEDVPASVAGRWSRLDMLFIGSRSLKRLTQVPCVRFLDLSHSDIKKIPDCVIALPALEILKVQHCRKLVSLQSLPPSLSVLDATGCGSLKSVCFSFDEPRAYITLGDCKCVNAENDAIRVSSRFYHPNRRVTFHNCLSLAEEARRVIIQRWAYMFVCLPGKEVPAYFTHKAKGNSITISPRTFSASSRFKACLLLSPTEQVSSSTNVVCRLRSNGVLINELDYSTTLSWMPPWLWYRKILTEHLLVFSGGMFKEHRCVEVDGTESEIEFEFSCNLYHFKNIVSDDRIIECGVEILADEGESSSSKWKEQNDGAVEVSNDESVVNTSKHTGWWSFLLLLKVWWSWLKKFVLKKTE